MGTFVVGVDFGTANTKAAVRDTGSAAAKPEPIVLVEAAQGAARYLLPSQSKEWDSKDPPKVKLLEDSSLAMSVENAAVHEAVAATVTALRASAQHIQKTRGGSNKFLLQMGYPAAHDVAIEDVRARYDLIADEACRVVSDKYDVQRSKSDIDERTAALAYLATANFELQNEPLFILDGGGFTTHTSIIRWRGRLAGYEEGTLLLGAQTVKHGAVEIVSKVSAALGAIRGLPNTSTYAVSIIDAVMAGFLRAADAGHRSIDEALETLSPEVSRQTAWRGLNVRQGDQLYCVNAVLAAFGDYSRSPILWKAWSDAWGPAWEHDCRDNLWARYRLLMMGGACRIGRQSGTQVRDSIAARIDAYQTRTRLRFTDVIYPETDPRFWPEAKPTQDLKDAMPYLFVACGYSIPFLDWPVELQRSPLPPEEKKEYEAPLGPILPTR